MRTGIRAAPEDPRLLFSDRLASRDLTQFWFVGGYSLDAGNKALNLGHPGEHAQAIVQGVYVADLVVEASVRILDSSEADGQGWAGLLMRGFGLGANTGYLVYVRARGEVELLTLDHKRIDLMSVRDMNPDRWVRIRSRLEGTTIEVVVDDMEPVKLSSAYYVGPGVVLLQSYHASSQFRDISIRELEPSRE